MQPSPPPPWMVQYNPQSPAARARSVPRKGSEAPTEGRFTQVRKGADQMRGYARMLVIDGDLRSAVNGLADDADQLVDVLATTGTGSVDRIAAGGGVTELLTIAGSVNSHARAAQRACDLPVTGIFRH